MGKFPRIGITFLITDIVRGEVKSHIARDTAEAAQKLKEAAQISEKRWKVKSLEIGIRELFDFDQDANDFAEHQLDRFASATKATLLSSADFASISDVVSDYFGTIAPFASKADKKHEFPDALALSQLEGWAQKNNTLVLAVSRDGGWKARAEISDHIICVDAAWDVYRLFDRADTYLARQFVDVLNRGDNQPACEAIDAELQRSAENLWPHIEAASGYQYEVEFEGLSFDERKPIDPADAVVIDADKESLTLAFPVTVAMTALAGFTFVIRDEGEYFPIGSASVEREVDVELTMAVVVSRSAANEMEVYDVEVEAERYSRIDFGDVEPDWDEGGPDDDE